MPHVKHRRHSLPAGELPLFHPSPVTGPAHILDTVQEGSILFPHKQQKGRRGRRASLATTTANHVSLGLSTQFTALFSGLALGKFAKVVVHWCVCSLYFVSDWRFSV